MGNVIEILKDPLYYYYYFMGQYRKEALFKKYSKLSNVKGIRKLYFILSFDSDTEEDIAVVWDIHQRLLKMGVKPVYAVPGELLLKGRDIYSKIASTGAEFINHGYRQHTIYNKQNGTYESILFYHLMSKEEIRKDIYKGDEIIKEVLGIRPQGFRIPHFGTCQNKELLNYIHSILKELGYKFSSSTLPYHGFRYGSVFNKYGLTEMPVSGKWTRPFEILDSWGCFCKEGKKQTTNEYYEEGIGIAKYFGENKISGILNYYADPSQVQGNEQFYKAVDEWKKVGVNISYSELLGDFSFVNW